MMQNLNRKLHLIETHVGKELVIKKLTDFLKIFTSERVVAIHLKVLYLTVISLEPSKNFWKSHYLKNPNVYDKKKQTQKKQSSKN